MQLSEEEKQALKEKYKQQRRAMWAGKRPSGTSDKSAADEIAQSEVETDNPNRDAIDHQDHKAHVVKSTIPAESECDTRSNAQLSADAEFADDAILPYKSASQSISQASETDGARSRESHTVEQNSRAANEPASETVRLVEKIRMQRREMREEQASIRACPPNRRRKVEKAEPNSRGESNEEGKSAMMTWKLVLGVIGTIIVLMAIGMMLGMWFANQ